MNTRTVGDRIVGQPAGGARRRKLLVGAGALAAVGAAGVAISSRSMGSMTDYEAAAAQSRSKLAANPEIGEFIRYATLAPNGHNTQPWRFRSHGNRIDILPDFTRRTPVVDPDDHHLFISLGCAAENLALASAANGRPADIRFDARETGGLVCELGRGASQESPLFDVIGVRQSTRAPFDGRPVGASEAALLSRAAEVPGTSVVLITGRPSMDKVLDLVIAGNSRQMADPAFVRELKGWLRFNPAAALVARDGLFAASSGNPVLPSWLAGTLFDIFFSADSENDKYRRHIDSSAGVAVFLAEIDNADHWTRIGRSFQRFALQATALGIKTAHLNQAIEVPDLRPELASLAGGGSALPFLVIRFGRGPTMPYSLRRPIADVMA